MAEQLNPIETFKAWPLWKQLLAIVGLPLLLILFLPKIPNMIKDYLESKKREEVDKKSNQLDGQITQHNLDAAKAQGEIDRLEKEKQDAKAKADSESAVDFHNNRKPPSK